MTVEDLTYTPWFGEYPLKYRDIHDAHFLSLMACQTLIIIQVRIYSVVQLL